jgi:hypothetical protein
MGGVSLIDDDVNWRTTVIYFSGPGDLNFPIGDFGVLFRSPTGRLRSRLLLLLFFTTGRIITTVKVWTDFFSAHIF